MRNREWKKRVGAVLLTICLLAGLGWSYTGDVERTMAATYTNVAFRDYQGLSDQEFGGGAGPKGKYCAYSQTVANMNGLAFEDDITFPASGSGGSFLYLASKGDWTGIQIMQNANFLQFQRVDNGGVCRIFNDVAGIEPGKKFRLRVEFNVEQETDIQLRISIDGQLRAEQFWGNLVSKLGTGIFLYTAANESLVLGNPQEPGEENPGGNEPGESLEQKTPAELGYTQVRPEDFGISDKTYSAKAGHVHTAKAYTGADALDKKYLDVILSFAGDDLTKDTSLRYLSENGWSGIQICVSGDSLKVFNALNGKGNTYTLEQTGLTTFAQSFSLKLGTDIGQPNAEGKQDVSYTLWINGKLIAKDEVLTEMGGLGKMLGVYTPNGSITLNSPPSTQPDKPEQPGEPLPQKTPEELGYTQVRPYDFAISDKTYSAKAGHVHTADVYTGKDTLNKKYLDVILSFAGDDLTKDTSLRYLSENGWSGIQICVSGTDLKIFNALNGKGNTYTLEQTGLTTFAKPFRFKLGTNIGQPNAEGKRDVSYTIWINGKLIAKDEVLAGMGGIGNMLGIYTPSGSITLRSPASMQTDKPEGKKEKLPTGFRSLTLHSFGLENQTCKHVDQYLSMIGKTIFPLDKTVFSCNITFSSKGGDLRYGGKTNEWCGILIRGMSDGKLAMMGVEGDTGMYLFKPVIAGTDLVDKEFNLKISTQYVDSDKDGKKDDVKIGIWFNDVLYDNTYIFFQDYVQYMGRSLSAYVESEEGFVRVRNDALVSRAVDFTLFGFTKNWIKELGIKR